MNGDPYRSTPQPADRRVINRSGAAYRPSDEPQPIKEEPQVPSQPRPVSASRSERYDNGRRPSKWPIWLSAILITAAIIGIGAYILLSNNKNTDTGIDSSKYQAVFLANGQVYFGKLQAYNEEYLKLTTGYSAQAKAEDAADATTETAVTDDGVQLIRLGDEVYGPENEIFISKAQVLHYENLKTDSKVTQLIEQNEKSR